MKRLAATREQTRELDRIATEVYGVSGLILMENAGRACAAAAAKMLGRADGKSVTVLCGRGNNGGDGFVVARHLTNWGAHLNVLLLAPLSEVLKGGGEPSVNLRILLNMGVQVRELATPEETAQAIKESSGSDLLVDALLGTGAQGEVREPFRSAIEAVNECACPVLAVDVPSGLDCNTGEPLGIAVRADRTVTFAVKKVGFLNPEAKQYTGRVEVAEISIPRAAIERLLKARPDETTEDKEVTETGQDELSERVIACAIAVHRALGPGLMESAYQQCLSHEMFLAGLSFAAEWPIPVEYRGVHLDCGYRADFLVGNALIVELKTVDRLLPIHDAQLLTYMRLAGVRVGLILNFNLRLLRDGIRRLVL